tara:strand:+ start:180 stop:650 length:471 start_codon:yes stop_codon:yes gene_type:complete
MLTVGHVLTDSSKTQTENFSHGVTSHDSISPFIEAKRDKDGDCDLRLEDGDCDLRLEEGEEEGERKDDEKLVLEGTLKLFFLRSFFGLLDSFLFVMDAMADRSTGTHLCVLSNSPRPMRGNTCTRKRRYALGESRTSVGVHCDHSFSFILEKREAR